MSSFSFYLQTVRKLLKGENSSFSRPIVRLSVAGVALGIVVMLVATLFKFKDLRLQMKLCKVNLTLIVALILSIFVMWFLQRGHGIAVMTLWMMLPFAAMVLTMMANGCIKNDQKLLSDSERLR